MLSSEAAIVDRLTVPADIEVEASYYGEYFGADDAPELALSVERGLPDEVRSTATLSHRSARTPSP